MKRKSDKLAKLERGRFSVFYEKLGMCACCGSMVNLTKHELLPGRNRQNSMKYGFVIPLCLRCHQMLQNDLDFEKKWKKKAQNYFENNYGTREQFIKIFGRNYL